MRYTKPSILATLNANRAIQTRETDTNKGTHDKLDSAPIQAYSTHGAYEADE